MMVVKSKVNVGGPWERWSAYRIFVENLEGEISLSEGKDEWEDIIKMLKKTRWKC
jgi:hypothetical protein